MPDLDTIEFVMRFALGLPTISVWIWAVITGIGIFFLLGLLGGRLWNNSWSLTFGMGTLVMIFSVLGAFAVFNIRSISNTENWLNEQKSGVVQSIAKANRFQRSVLVETWSHLEPRGGQQDLIPPDQSGDQMRLNTPEDAVTLSKVSAEETRSTLRLKPPFLFGASLETRNPDDIATETVNAININSSDFPKVVSSDNEWTVTAATIQANFAFESCLSKLSPKFSELKNVSYILLGISIILPFTLCTIKSLDDIKVNPKV